MLLVLALLVAGVVWAGVQGSAAVSRWADVSAMWLIAPKLLVGLLQLALVLALTIGIARLIAVLPPYFRIAQDFMLEVQARTRRLSDQVTEPFLKLEEFSAYLKAWRAQIYKRKG
jgi:hypothetical protein